MVDEILDCTGLMCPEPVMMLHSKVADLMSGQVLEVRATDPSTERDIPKFCQFLGHELIQASKGDSEYTYLIKVA